MSAILPRICLLFTLFLMACSSNPKDNARLSEQQYFEHAQKALEKENYVLAVQQLEQLESRFPFGRYHEQTQLDLIYAYYQSLDYTASMLQAQQFLQQYPEHSEADYAYYMKGLANYSVDRGFLNRLLPTKPSERDLLSIKRAFSDFAQLLNKFPNSRYAKDAQQRMRYLRNLLADHELKAANFYFKRSAYVASLKRSHEIITHFPNTPSVEPAMIIAIQSYRAIGQTDRATETETLLKVLFPNSKSLNKEGKIPLPKGLNQSSRSLLNVMTFGLLG